MSDAVWRPKDFITNGVNCPISAIKQQLALIRSGANAEWVLLLVYQEEPLKLLFGSQDNPEIVTKDRFFQSLALLAHRDLAIQSSAATSDVFERLSAGRIAAPSEGPIPTGKATTLPISPSWRTLLTSGGSRDLYASWISDPIICQPSPSAGYPTRVCLITLAKDSLGLQNTHAPLTDDFLSMINSSVPVVANRNLNRIKLTELVIAHYEEKFEIERLVNDSISSEDYWKLLGTYGDSVLKAALILTGSSTGNLYLSMSDKQSLALVSEVNNECAIRSLPLDKPQSVVGFVYFTAKPLLINNLSDFRRTHPDVSYRWVGARTEGMEPYAELAVPIIQPNPGSSTLNILGVLNVEKVHPIDRGYYSDHDIDILRMLALRFCLWRLGLVAALASRSLWLETASERVEEVHTVKSLTTLVDNRIPYDFHEVQERLSDILRQAYYLTRSKTATIRLLSTDALQLVRFCACPDEVMAHPHETIPIARSNSVNAFVARTGEACDLKDLVKRKSFLPYRGLLNVLTAREGIRSEYCLPIIIRGRLVGTINLESEYIDAYSGEKHFLHAVLGQVQLALSFAQTRHEDSVLSAGARVTMNAHELLKCTSELGTLARSAPNHIQEKLRGLHTRLTMCALPSHGDKRVDDGVPARTGYRKLIQQLSESRNIAHTIEWHDPDEVADDSIPEASCSMIRLVLWEILDNSFSQATKVPGGRIRVSLKQTVLGGRRYTIILISNPLQVMIGEDIIGKLYRVPIQKEDRPHIGAFLAGAMMRSVGGDITFSISKKAGLATTTGIEMPML
jgi:GAF domain-containing protein